MTRLDLVKSARYRVLSEEARLSRMVPCSFALSKETRPLAPGEVITHLDGRTGWGSDPGFEEVFVTEDGWEGALWPAGIWGGVSDAILALADEEGA